VATWEITLGPIPPKPPAPRWEYLIESRATGSVRYCDDYLGPEEQGALYEHCLALPGWEFNKPLGTGRCQRRGICMQAVPGVHGYRYSGQEVVASPLDNVLGPLLDRVNAEQQSDYNSWLLNMYRPKGRDGSAGDYIGPHSDNQRELGKTADGKSVVFGLTLTEAPICQRPLVFKKKNDTSHRELVTRGGQAYVMEGTLQTHWTHELPKRQNMAGIRISLTARKFVI